MKTKNVKVRKEDIKAGRMVYVSHPVYGIEACLILSRPYQVSDIGMAFNYRNVDHGYETHRFLNDSGISNGDSYNNKRTFFKIKHAKEWARKMAKSHIFIARQERHERFVSEINRDFAYE